MDLFIPSFLLGANLILTLYIQYQGESKAQPVSSWEWHMKLPDYLDSLFLKIKKLINASDGRKTDTILRLKDDIRGLNKEFEDFREEFRDFKRTVEGLCKSDKDEETD